MRRYYSYFALILCFGLLTAARAGAQTLELKPFADTRCFVGGETDVLLEFEADVSVDSFAVDNDFILELSDAGGSFAAPTELSRINSSTGTGENYSFSFTLPGPVNPGDDYRLRVVSTNPETVSDEIEIQRAWLIDVALPRPFVANCTEVQVLAHSDSLEWNDAVDPADRRVEYSGDGGATWTDLGQNGPTILTAQLPAVNRVFLFRLDLDVGGPDCVLEVAYEYEPRDIINNGDISTPPPLSCDAPAGFITIEQTRGANEVRYRVRGPGQNENDVRILPPTPYTIPNLEPGRYTIFVEDQEGCTDSVIVNLIEENNTSLEPNIRRPLCGEDGFIGLFLTPMPSAGDTLYINGQAFTDPVFRSGISYLEPEDLMLNFPGDFTFVYQTSDGCTDTLRPNFDLVDVVVEPPVLGCDNAGDVRFWLEGADAFHEVIWNAGFVDNQGETMWGGDELMLGADTASLDGLPAGQYKLRFRYPDSPPDCWKTVSFELESSKLRVDSVRSTPPCTRNSFDGEVEIFVSGGRPPYWFKMAGDVDSTQSNLFTGLPASGGGLNFLVYDASACDTSLIVPLPAISDAADPRASTLSPCEEGEGVVILLANGAGPYEYALTKFDSEPAAGDFGPDNRFEGLATDAYAGFIRASANCVFEVKPILVEPPVRFRPDTVASRAPSCFNANDGWVVISVENDAPGPFEYSLDGGTAYQPFTPGDTIRLRNGTYELTVRDTNGCVEPEEPITFRFDTPEFQFAQGVYEPFPPACAAGTDGRLLILLAGGTAPYEYRMLPDGDWQASNEFGNLTAGNYHFEFRDANGCTFRTNFPNGEGLVLEGEEPIRINLETQDPGCAPDGRIFDIAAENGTPPYQYSLDGANWQDDNFFDALSGGVYTVFARDADGCEGSRSVTLEPATALDFAVQLINNPTCADPANGRIRVLIENPEDYIFRVESLAGDTLFIQAGDTSFRALPAGAFNVFVLDPQNGCEDFEEITLSDDDVFQLDSVSVAVDTCGGSANLIAHASGGALPYNYALSSVRLEPEPSPMFEGVDSSGNYVVIAVDGTAPNNCFAQEEITIEIPDTFTIDTTITQPTCANNEGTISVIPDGSAGPFGFSIDRGQGPGPVTPSGDFPGLTAGIYFITVYDSSTNAICQKSFSFQLAAPGAPEADTSVTQPVCADDGIIRMLNARGGTQPYVFALDSDGDGAFDAPGDRPFSSDNVFEDLPPGQYNAYVRDAEGCERMYEVTLDSPASFIVELTVRERPSCLADGSIEVVVKNTNGETQPAADYEYALGGNADGDFGPSNLFTGLGGGPQEFYARNAEGCIEGPVSLTLREPQPLAFTSVISADASCEGEADGSVTFETNWPSLQLTTVELNGAPETLPLDGLAEGDYTLRVVTENGCEAETTFTIGATPGFDAELTPEDAECGGLGSISVEITGGPQNAAYEFWLENDPATVYDYPDENAIPDLPGGDYAVVVLETASGCRQTLTATVGVTDAPRLNADATDAGCEGADGFILLNPSGGATPYEIYYIESAEDSTLLDGPPYELENLAPGMYRFRIEDAEGCAVYETVEIGGGPSFTVEAEAIHPTCGATGRIEIKAFTEFPLEIAENIQDLQPGEDPVFRPFANGAVGVTDADAPFEAPNNLPEGRYIYYLRDEQNSKCADTVVVDLRNTRSINVKMEDVIIDPACYGGAGDGGIDVVSEVAFPADYRLVNNDNSQSYNRDDVQNLADAPGFADLAAGGYLLTITDADGCDTTLVVTVETHPEPAIINAGDEISEISCNGANDGAIRIEIDDAAAPYQYSVNGGSNQDADDGVVEETGLEPGMYAFVFLDANQCDFSAEYELAEPPALTMRIDEAIDPSCYDRQDGRIAFSAVGGVPPHVYDLGPASEIPGGNMTAVNATTSEGALENLAGGDYEIFVRDARECEVSETATLTEPAELTLDATPTNPDCAEDAEGEIALTAGGGAGGYEFSINGGTAWQSGAVFRDLDAEGGSKVYDVIARDRDGCETSVSVTLQAPVVQLPQPLAPELFICQDDALTETKRFPLNDLGSPAGGTWSGTNVKEVDGEYFFEYNEGTGNGAFTITYQVGDCAKSTELNYNRITLPDPPQTEICNNEASFMLPEARPAGGQWRAENQGLNFDPATGLLDLTDVAPGDYVFVYALPNVDCEASYTVTVRPAPEAAFSSDVPLETVLRNSPVNFANQSVSNDPANGAMAYRWTFGDGSAPQTTETARYAWPDSGRFDVELRAENAYGCADSVAQTVQVLPDVRLDFETVFTPNGDGINDRFPRPGAFPPRARVELTVFDRTGRRVFSGSGASVSWDGAHNGSPAPEGVYFYRFVVTDDSPQGFGTTERTGSLTLIR